jgi:hypothetical protein
MVLEMKSISSKRFLVCSIFHEFATY